MPTPRVDLSCLRIILQKCKQPRVVVTLGSFYDAIGQLYKKLQGVCLSFKGRIGIIYPMCQNNIYIKNMRIVGLKTATKNSVKRRLKQKKLSRMLTEFKNAKERLKGVWISERTKKSIVKS